MIKILANNGGTDNNNIYYNVTNNNHSYHKPSEIRIQFQYRKTDKENEKWHFTQSVIINS